MNHPKINAFFPETKKWAVSDEDMTWKRYIERGETFEEPLCGSAAKKTAAMQEARRKAAARLKDVEAREGAFAFSTSGARSVWLPVGDGKAAHRVILGAWYALEKANKP